MPGEPGDGVAAAVFGAVGAINVAARRRHGKAGSRRVIAVRGVSLCRYCR